MLVSTKLEPKDQPRNGGVSSTLALMLAVFAIFDKLALPSPEGWITDLLETLCVPCALGTLSIPLPEIPSEGAYSMARCSPMINWLKNIWPFLFMVYQPHSQGAVSSTNCVGMKYACLMRP